MRSHFERTGRPDFGKRPIRFRVGQCLAFLIAIGALPHWPRRPAGRRYGRSRWGLTSTSTFRARPAHRGPAWREVRDWVRQAGWDENHQLLLSDFGAPDPGRPDEPASNILPRKANLDWAFRQWLFAKARPGDLVVFYFAGRHGAVVTPQGPRVDPRVDYYVLPADATPDSVEKTGWSLDRVIDECARRELQGCLLAGHVGRRARCRPHLLPQPGGYRRPSPPGRIGWAAWPDGRG